MTIYYLNLIRAVNRRDAMKTAFSGEALERIPAQDGLDWSNGVARLGRPLWKGLDRERLIAEGLLAVDSDLPPTHVACNLSHKAAWDTFLASRSDLAVILEDDVEPHPRLKGQGLEDALNMPAGVDFLYLIDPGSVPGRLSVRGGQIRHAFTFAAYALTRHGARVLSKALTPMRHLADFQLPICCFEGQENWVSRFSLQAHESKIKIKAAVSEGLVRPSKLARVSQLGHGG